VSYCGTHRANSQPFGDWEAEENGKDNGKGSLRKDLSLVRMQPLAWKKKRFLCNHVHVSHVLVTLTLSTPMDARLPGDHGVQVWSQSSHLSRSRSDLLKKFTDGQTDDGRLAIVLAHGMS